MERLQTDLYDETSRQQLKNKLQIKASMVRLEGYRDVVYFILNFIAFYGYTIGILTFYWDDEDQEPHWLKWIKFHQSHAHAEWCGNFAGDLMWTIEPLVVLVSPSLFPRIIQKQPQLQRQHLQEKKSKEKEKKD